MPSWISTRRPAAAGAFGTSFAKAFSTLAIVATSACAIATELTPFSENGTARHPAWEKFVFAKGKALTEYSIEKDAEHGLIVRAHANNAASALMHRFDTPPAHSTMLRWSWKLLELPTGSDAKSKEGDDFAARIYVAFKYEPARASAMKRAQFGVIRALYGEYPPTAALVYICEPHLPEGTIVSSPFTDTVKMIVVDNTKSLGTWRSFSRNIVEDYQRAFGEPINAPIAGIAIMTDTDNTHSKAGALYGKITLSDK